MSTVKLSKTNDLTEGVIWKKLLLFFIPIAVGTLLQQLYNAVDAIIVGRFVGTKALAAVGGSSAIMAQFVITCFVALANGATVIVAQKFGAKDKENTSKAIGTAVSAFFIIGIVISILMLFCSEPFLKLLNTPAETIADSARYCKIYFAGSIFMIIFNIGSGILRAVGDSRKPLIYLIISCCSNIVLDLIFVVVLGWGVEGVAVATVMAQAISCIFIMYNLIKTDEIYKLTRSNLKIDFRLFRNMMRIGVPTCVQSSMYGISNLILTVAVNGLGTVVVASWAMSGKIDGVYWAISEAFGIALMNFVAQNYGAAKKERIKQGTKIGLIVFMSVTIALTIILLLVSRPLLTIFTKDQAVRDTTWQVITYFVPFYFSWTIIEAFSGILRGVGDTLKPAVILAVGICGVRLLWVFTVFQMHHTLFVVSMSYPISWILTGAALIIYYLKRKKEISA